MATVSDKTVGRLSLYRRLLYGFASKGVTHIYSHDLSGMASTTSAQVRRDLMAVGYTGSSSKGYEVERLLESICRFLDAPAPQAVALVGVGNLGRAIMTYFAGRRPHLAIVAAFDKDPYKTDRVIHGCRCYSFASLSAVVREKGVRIGIITVPAEEAQLVADELCRAGVRGIVNFVPVPLRVPPGVYVEDIDMTMSLEKVAYFARAGDAERETNP